MLPETPGITIVAAAMIPTRNSRITFIGVMVTLAWAPLFSPRSAMPTTRAKKSRKQTAMLVLKPL